MTTKRINRKIAGFFGGLAIIPLLAACGPETTTTQEEPAVAPTVTPTVTPTTPVSPTTGATQNENIVAVASGNDSFATLSAAIAAAGLTETLAGQGPFTVFAPTEEAFAAVPEATRQQLLQPENQATLRRILQYHVVPGEITSSQLQAGEVNTVEGEPLNVQIDATANQVRVNDATVTQPDIQASNGVIHAIDRVILPPNLNL